MLRYMNIHFCGLWEWKNKHQISPGIWTTAVGDIQKILPRRQFGKDQRAQRSYSLGTWFTCGRKCHQKDFALIMEFIARGPEQKAVSVDKWYISEKLHLLQLCKSFNLTHLRNHGFQYFFTQSIQIVGSGTWDCILILHPAPCQLSTATILLVELIGAICFICTLHVQLNIKSTSI